MNPDGRRPGPLRAVPAESLTTRQRDQAREVYHQAFPPHLRVPFEELARPGPDDLLLVGLAGPDPVAFAAMLMLRRAGWTFLRYYGIAPARRREGLGRASDPLVTAALASVCGRWVPPGESPAGGPFPAP